MSFCSRKTSSHDSSTAEQFGIISDKEGSNHEKTNLKSPLCDYAHV